MTRGPGRASALVDDAGSSVTFVDAHDVTEKAVERVVVTDHDQLVEALKALNLIAEIGPSRLIEVGGWLVEKGDPDVAQQAHRRHSDRQRGRHLLATGKLGEPARLPLAARDDVVVASPLDLDATLIQDLRVDAR